LVSLIKEESGSDSGSMVVASALGAV